MKTTKIVAHGSENSSQMDLFQMGKLTNEASKKSELKMLKDSPSVIGLPEFLGGRSPSSSPDGQATGQSGQEVVLASRSAPPEKAKEPPTQDTSGPSLPNSSAKQSLQSSLVSRLQARLAGRGSVEYSLTWKEWAIQGQEPICAVRASVRRTSDKDFSGWPTPRTLTGGAESAEWKQELGRTESGVGDLQAVALTAGWPTPDTCAGGTRPSQKNRHTARLQDAVPEIVGWSTPNSRDWKDSASPEALTRAMNGPGGQANLPRQVAAHLSGPTPSSSPAATEKADALALNAKFSLWLMGYPTEWEDAGRCALLSLRGLEMQSSRKSRRNSSEPSSNP